MPRPQLDGRRPSFVTLHNSASPSLADKPNGLTKQHIKNLESYYRDKLHRSVGPHLFIDDKQIRVFTPPTFSGVHSPCFNKIALGVEMLGDYNKEAFDKDRGLKVQENAVAAFATLHAVLGLDPDTIKLHKEDKCTSHDCPGKNVKKKPFIQKVKDLMEQRHGGGHLDAVA